MLLRTIMAARACAVCSLKPYDFRHQRALQLNRRRPQQRHSVRHITTANTDFLTVTVTQMRRFLCENSLGFENGPTCLQVMCPACNHRPKPTTKAPRGSTTATASTKTGKDIVWAFINKITGLFVCYACQSVASWNEFEAYVLSVKSGNEDYKRIGGVTPYFPTEDELAHLTKCYNDASELKDDSAGQVASVLNRFELNRLYARSLTFFGGRISHTGDSLLFPIYNRKRLIALKELKDTDNGIVVNTLPRPNMAGLFGWEPISQRSQEVILTASPQDAIAVRQQTDLPVLAVDSVSNLPVHQIPLLESFKKITLWLGNTVTDWQAVKTFSRKLDEKRCRYVRPVEENPRALLALQSTATPQRQLKSIIAQAQPLIHEYITTFRDMRNELADQLRNSDQAAGIPWKRFYGLTKLLKGHRRGELTVFTGPTGSGKTTLMCEYSLDLSEQGVNTLWGSFEISNARLLRIMVTQFAGKCLETNMKDYEAIADKFERLPLYFMTFHGEQTLPKVISTMSHAVYCHDIQHVVVDNLQFMMGMGSGASAMDRFSQQDHIVAAFRTFATRHCCHVTLVMHPRKERESDALDTSSIFGGAKASQEADNVLILQNLKSQKYLQVTKNRYDGETGKIPLEFYKPSLSFDQRKAGHRKVYRNNPDWGSRSMME